MEYKYEPEVLAYLKKARKAPLAEIAKSLGLAADALMRPASSLEEKGLIRKELSASSFLLPTEDGKPYFEGKREFPEFGVHRKALAGKGVQDLTPEERQFGIKWAKEKGLVEISEGKLIPKKSDAKIPSGTPAEVMAAFDAKELVKRGFATEKTEKEIFLEITEKGREAEISREGIARLTSEMLRTGAWKREKFKKYDISVPAKDAQLGKEHPLMLAIGKIRRTFAEMGFTEMEGNYVESAFWNFDALFQPQDHPARELADTFYLEGEEPLPDKKLVERVKKAHEKGWGYEWSRKEAKRRLLRTHTTTLSARYLASMEKTPKKYFAIGRVFRNEATDYKHLAEFHQVEGIVAWENATFRDLLGLLKEFYARLGFRKIKFRPSYFPYTEPSLEIIVYFEPRKEWVEMGGAGIMRPEVSIPLAGTYPVLAWGLSLERPLMMLMGISDIRTFYKNDLAWLRNAKVKI